MGREVRRVAANWEHPKDENGHYIPLLAGPPGYTPDEIAEGLAEGWLKGEAPNWGLPVMPQWSEAERTHWQMYEDTTEGTPISPVMADPDELAHWLADTNASAFGAQTATYEQWRRTIERGYAISAYADSSGVHPGTAL